MGTRKLCSKRCEAAPLAAPFGLFQSEDSAHGVAPIKLHTGLLSKNRIKVRDFGPGLAGSCSTQAKETRHRSFLPCREKHVTCAVPLRD